MDVNERIKSQIAENRVILYMKGTPQFPMCGFSSRAAAAIKQTGIKFAHVNVLADQEIREQLPHYSDWPTFPQLFVNGELIGGCDIVLDLLARGELAKVLSAGVESSHS